MTKWINTGAAAVAGLAISLTMVTPAQARTFYTLSSVNLDTGAAVSSFSIDSARPVQRDRVFLSRQLDVCEYTPGVPCQSVTFDIDSVFAGGGPNDSAVLVSTGTATIFYYFPQDAFLTAGTYIDQGRLSDGWEVRLSVFIEGAPTAPVPELPSGLLMAGGLGAWMVLRRSSPPARQSLIQRRHEGQ